MTHLMTHQHIIYDPRSTIPVGQGKHTVLHVKGRCRDLTVLYDKVLGCQQAGKVAFDFLVAHGSLSLMQ
jgi:hypothetical protein